ncbi:sodium:solute symporter [Paraglaciecola aquimarina]|uniref:Sodium:solute symporter n=1 Tax=Paraglaciecola aquimarina TaxID=1235557 RepID=A0ABU3SWD3_9ALTE|nr:sodium:solute symporter [Paraglaciecola aquimarina]MDU0354321.1 sodium:solute symporter [Paraglaciecola aquimarina]
MNIFDYSIVVIYLVLLVGMGFCFRQQNTKDDYFLGGRNLGWKALTLSVMATQLSAISFISAPAFVGLREGGGLHWLSYELGVPLAMLLLLSTILPVLYRSGFVSIYDYLEQRFGRSTRILISIVFQFSRAFATGIMIFAVSLILQGTMGIEALQAIVVTGVITVLYSLQGGMKAVVYGDAIQMIIIVLGTIACIGFGLYHLGGIDEFMSKVDPARLQAIKPESLGFSGDGFGLLPMIFGGFVLYASYYGCDQTQAQRALAAKNTNDLKFMMLANATVRFPITLLYCFSGLIVGTLAMTESSFMQQIPTENPDWMMPIFILNYLPHGMIGILVVAILAAAMSSLSSAINSLAAVTIEDYCRLTNKQYEPEDYLKKAKYVGLIWGAITLVLSFYAGNIAPTVIEAINKVGSVFYGPILAVFLLGVVNKRIRAKEINIGLIAGVGFNIFIWLALPDIFWFWWNFIGFVTAAIVAYALSIGNKGEVNTQSIQAKEQQGAAILSKKDVVILVTAFCTMLVICILIPLLFL